MIQWATTNPGYAFLSLLVVCGSVERIFHYLTRHKKTTRNASTEDE